MWLDIFGLVSGVVFVFALQYVAEWVYYFTRDYPSYFPTPFFGVRLWQAISFRECFHLSSFFDISQSFKWTRIYGTFLWHNPLISVNDASALRQMLLNFKVFDRAWYEIAAFREFLGGGLILARNAKWSHTRPTIARLFGRAELKYFVPVIQHRAAELVDVLRDIVKRPDTVVDMQEHLFLVSFDVMLQKVFGQNSTLETSKHFSDCFHTLLKSSIQKMLWPFLRIPVDKLLFFLPVFRRGIAARKEINAFITHHVKEARRREDLYAGTILASLMEEGKTNAAFSSDEQIADEVLTLLFAGHVKSERKERKRSAPLFT